MRYLRYLRRPRVPGGRPGRRAFAALAAAVLAGLALAVTGSGAAWARPAAGALPSTASAATTPGCAATSVSDGTWMHDLAPCLQDQPLAHIMIPGSHDTLTYSFSPGQALDIATSQDKEITDQLNDGIRAFDIRVGFNNDKTHGWGYYAQHGSVFSTWLKLPRVFADIEAWALAPGHEHETILLSLAIQQSNTVPFPITWPFPASDCQDFGAALGGSLVTPDELQAHFRTKDPGQVTLGQLWSLPDPKHAARVILNNDQCMDAADSSAGQWAGTPFNSFPSGSYYADQTTANGRDPSLLVGINTSPTSCPNQQEGITKMVLAAAGSRATQGGGIPDKLGPSMVGGIWTLFIQGTPEANCLYTPKSMVPAERTVLDAVHGAWLAEPSIRSHLNVVSGDFVEDVPLVTDTIATDESLDLLSKGTGYEWAFQASDGHLRTGGFYGDKDWGLGMRAGTSPALAALPGGGGYEVAFQAANGDLWTDGPDGGKDRAQGMMSGTSPAIAALSGGGYEMAFQASNGHLWTVGTDGSSKDWGPGMKAGTSPAITALSGGGYVVAFQDSNGRLWTDGSDGSSKAWGLEMKAGTSPAITFDGAGYEVAFQANTGKLWTVGTDNHWDWGLEMRAGTSPAITGLTGGGYEVGFQANTGNLWTVGTDNHWDWHERMMAGTSPAITALAGGSYVVAFQGSDGSLWTGGHSGSVDSFIVRAPMTPTTSPSIAGIGW